MGEAVRFLLGDRVVEVPLADPTLTLLHWLRAAGRPGTKEGCAEGDCGACTVVLGDLDPDGRLVHRAVNACILFLPQVDGKQVITVEDLADGGALHPVQSAMVAAHAAQCGFCTPGFVMALFALRRAGVAATDSAALHDGLAGNLCRCTGYRPILEAGRRALADAQPDRFDRTAADTAARLATLRRDRGLAVGAGDRRFLQPRTPAALEAALAAHPDARILAGGTDVGLWVTKHLTDLPTIVHLGEVAELAVVEEHVDRLVVGAAVTYAALLPVLDRRLPALAHLVRRIGGAQVRNSGTLVGNVANGSPIGDSMPALLALGAELTLNRAGARRTLPLDAFYPGYRKTALEPGEFVERVAIPLPGPADRFATWKVSKRRDQDISAVCAAFRLTLADDGTVAAFRAGYGGMAAVPARARALEAALAGRPWTAETVLAALPALADDFRPLTDMRATAGYRMAAARNLVLRFHAHTAGEPAYALPDDRPPAREATHG